MGIYDLIAALEPALRDRILGELGHLQDRLHRTEAIIDLAADAIHASGAAEHTSAYLGRMLDDIAHAVLPVGREARDVDAA